MTVACIFQVARNVNHSCPLWRKKFVPETMQIFSFRCKFINLLAVHCIKSADVQSVQTCSGALMLACLGTEETPEIYGARWKLIGSREGKSESVHLVFTTFHCPTRRRERYLRRQTVMIIGAAVTRLWIKRKMHRTGTVLEGIATRENPC